MQGSAIKKNEFQRTGIRSLTQKYFYSKILMLQMPHIQD